MQNGIREILSPFSIIPVAVLQTQEQADLACTNLLEKGIGVIEITLRTARALDLIRYVSTRYGSNLIVGAGTVCSSERAEAAAKAGASFLVSPGQTEQLVNTMRNTGLPFLPGAISPTEIQQSMERDLEVLKFFPAHVFGGVSALSAYASVFQGIDFIPTGGINEHSMSDYLALPNVLAVGGSWMLK
jgi:2-dehydro-3-deoxyphosphogluconate aldolase/(4S)-4-hydroxy-2-oxoglutarate aldolase